MRNRMIGACLALLMALGTVLPAQALQPEEYPQWLELTEELAVRYTLNGGEISRVEPGDVFKMEFWINGIDPYSMVLPISWDPAVVAVYDEKNEAAATSGRKTESDIGGGFRPAASLFDKEYSWNLKPLYWNGKAIYSSGDSDEKNQTGYPYLDQTKGHMRFFFYVDAPTASYQPQQFLEVTFVALQAGKPNFHFSTHSDPAYDRSSPRGILMGYRSSGVESVSFELPPLTVIKDQEEYTDPGRTNTGGNTSGGSTTPSQPTKPETPPASEATLIPAGSPECFPYSAPSEAKAVIQTGEKGGTVAKTDNYAVSVSDLADAINKAVSKNAGTILISMPEKRIDKADYTVTIPCDNLQDLTNRSDAGIYAETPWGYVGFLPASVQAEYPNAKTVTLSVKPGTDGLSFSVAVDGKTVSGFGSPALRVILPGARDGLSIWSATLFGPGYTDRGAQPLPISKAYAKSVAAVTACPGTYQLVQSAQKAFTDVPETFWGYQAISRLAKAGVVTGTTDVTYAPQDLVTRAQLATLLTRALGTYQANPVNTFTDMDGNYLLPFVASASQVGIVTGYPEGTFKPANSVTRQDMAVMVYRGMTLLGILPAPTREAPVFTDEDQIAGYAKEAVTALYRTGLINGMGDGTFAPRATTTRAQAAQLLSGVYSLVQNIM